MDDSGTDERSVRDREPIVSEGRYAVVEAEDADAADYWFVAGGDNGENVEGGESGGIGDRAVPLTDVELDDAATALSRFRNARTDSEGRGSETESGTGTELTCHECGTTWTYTGSDEHAACPNCETEVPVEGIGP